MKAIQQRPCAVLQVSLNEFFLLQISMNNIRNNDSKSCLAECFAFQKVQYFKVEPKPSEDTSLNI